MSENLNEAINNNIQAQQRAIAINTLGTRLHLTVGKIATLVQDPDHGETISTITLQELVDIAMQSQGEAEPEPEVSASSSTRAPRGRKKTTTKKPAAKKKATKKKSTAKKTTKKKATKKTTKKTPAKKRTASSSTRSDAGKKKPRLNRDVGHKEVLAALKAAKGPTALKEVVDATGLPDTQVRTFLKELGKLGKVSSTGKARATRYELA
jgi:outer membrane biosynthesis protein TonB